MFFDQDLCAHHFTYMENSTATSSSSTTAPPSGASWPWPGTWVSAGLCWSTRRWRIFCPSFWGGKRLYAAQKYSVYDWYNIAVPFDVAIPGIFCILSRAGLENSR